MARRTPSPVVSEKAARRSVDKLTQGIVADAHAAGKLPPMREIEQYAQDVTRETINRHEDQFRNGVPEAQILAPDGSPARIDQGSIEDEFGTVTKVARAVDAKRLREVRGGPVSLEKLAHQYEAQCMAARLTMLLALDETGKRPAFPEWYERIHKEWAEVSARARVAGLSPAEVNNVATDAILNILDQSDMVFGRDLGPWRHPKSRPVAAIGAI